MNLPLFNSLHRVEYRLCRINEVALTKIHVWDLCIERFWIVLQIATYTASLQAFMYYSNVDFRPRISLRYGFSFWRKNLYINVKSHSIHSSLSLITSRKKGSYYYETET